MERKMKHFLLALMVLFVASCAQPEKQAKNGKLKILTTTGIIADVVQNIVGDKAEVTALMGPGVDPHLYKATQSDLTKMNEADIILYNGLHLEGKMVEVLEKLAHRKPVKAVTDVLDRSLLRKAPSGGATDPHIWPNVGMWAQVTEGIGNDLALLDTANAEFYLVNTKAYVAQLIELDEWARTMLASIPEGQRTLVTAHDAFEYFGAAYQVDVHGLQGISTVSDFGLQDVTALVDLIVERNIKAVFVESSVSERSVNAVVEGSLDRGHEVIIGGTLYSDALGDPSTPEGTYIGMIQHNVNTIVESLK